MSAIASRTPPPRLGQLVRDIEAAIVGGDRAHQSALVLRSADALTRRWSRLAAGDKPGFDQLLAGLLREVDEAARIAFAERLTPLRRAPRLTTAMLAEDVSVRVAAPLLSRCRSLDEAQLLNIVVTSSDAHRCAIAQRPALTKALSVALIKVESPRVAAALLANPDATISVEALPTLMRMAATSEAVAIALGTRGDLPSADRAYLVDLARERACASLGSDGFSDQMVVKALLSGVACTFATPVATERSARFAGAASIANDVFGLHPVASVRIERWIELRRIEDVLAVLARDAGLPVAVLVACHDAAEPTALAVVVHGLNHPWSILKGLLQARHAGSATPETLGEAYRIQAELSPISARQLARYAATRLSLSAFATDLPRQTDLDAVPLGTVSNEQMVGGSRATIDG